MKASQPVLFVSLVALFATGCATATKPAVTVGSDQIGGGTQNTSPYPSTILPSGPDFSKYKTYSWASQVTNQQNGTFFLNDLLFKGMVRDAVEHEMAAKGYNYQPTGGDLIVNFRSFDQPTEIVSNQNLGAGYWADNEAYNYNTQNKVKLDKGSILVQLIDRKQGVEVWQGYASGLTNGNAFDKNKDKVYVAVGQIFERYNHRGDRL